MPLNGNQTAVLAIGGIGILFLLWMANQQTGESPVVPDTQDENQVMGMGVQAGMRVNAGTPLDTDYTIHGWHPGYDPVPTAQPISQSKHRYPALPGGNISTVIHHGWQNVKAPAGNDWIYNPPEAAVL